jgi:hypothetical protein
MTSEAVVGHVESGVLAAVAVRGKDLLKIEEAEIRLATRRCCSTGRRAILSRDAPVSREVPATTRRTSGAMRSPRVASRWTDRSDCPVLAAVSAVNAGAKLALALPIDALAAWAPATCCLVSGCNAS